MKMPTVYIPHGGGPWPFVDLSGFMPKADTEKLKRYLVELPSTLPEKPKALVVFSAHWEEPKPTVMTSPRPPMYYDYSGFGPESYAITWPAPGDPELARQVASLLQAAGFQTAEDSQRGFDHGTFIPFKVAWPQAEIPCIQVSLKTGLDPEEHLAMGRAISSLRDEGVLLLGSGMSYHNMRGFGSPQARTSSLAFDAWLRETSQGQPQERDARLRAWKMAPSARMVHPREEHLLPLMVMAGAGGEDLGKVTYNEEYASVQISAIQFG